LATVVSLFPDPGGATGIPESRMCQDCRARKLAICAALGDSELAKLHEIVSHVRLAPGQTLFYEGDPANRVFNVATGTLRLSKLLADGRRQVTGFALPGDFLGLSTEGMFTCSAEAVTDAGICRFDAREFSDLCAKFTNLERRLLDKARDDLVAAQEQMLLLGRKAPVEKIASFLLDLSERASAWGMPESPVLLPMSRADIADYLGLTIETVSRSFTKLRSVGAIELPESHRVVLCDIKKIKDLAVGEV
jgi:CRP/FNR family transcriptional regulator